MKILKSVAAPEKDEFLDIEDKMTLTKTKFSEGLLLILCDDKMLKKSAPITV